MYPRTMSFDADGKQRVAIPTVIGHFNETAEKPLSKEEVGFSLGSSFRVTLFCLD